MEIYLVGGAIRDRLLGLPIKERDWVVVGGSPEALIAAGYQPVGKDFPVFLHPETHEEYALARTERKTAKGYKGFVFHTSPDVTLKEDLKRRDLTINAIAESESGDLIDPYHGQADLKRKVLRHISPAFSEDPVRILRLARFAAKLPDFSIHPETNQLMQKMVKHGEVDALVAERVWQECSRALQEPATERFFEVLSDCHALPILFPMISLHSKGFCALKKTKNPQIRFSVLLHDIERDQLNTLCKRYRVPKAFSELACLTQAHHIAYTNILTASPEALLRFIKKTDAIRRPDRFALFLKACATLPIEVNHRAHKERLERAIVRLKNVDIPSLQKQGLQGKAFVNALEKMQINCLQDL